MPLTPLAALALASLSAPAAAQELGDGDYEQCRVYRNGEYKGLSQSCLARKRAEIRRYDRRGERGRGRYDRGERYADNGVYRCPSWANDGRGYKMTFYSDGRAPNYFGNFDRTQDGRPCLPSPNYRGTGYY